MGSPARTDVIPQEYVSEKLCHMEPLFFADFFLL